MYACEIWGTLSADLSHQILEAAYLHNKKLYRRVVNDMAANLRKRPQRLLDTPRIERHPLFSPLLSAPQFDVLSQNLLMCWLAHEQTSLICAFLDQLGIPHDEKGFADNLGDEPSKETLTRAVSHLYDHYPQDVVTTYLQAFETICGVSWKELSPLIRTSPPEGREDS